MYCRNRVPWYYCRIGACLVLLSFLSFVGVEYWQGKDKVVRTDTATTVLISSKSRPAQCCPCQGQADTVQVTANHRQQQPNTTVTTSTPSVQVKTEANKTEKVEVRSEDGLKATTTPHPTPAAPTVQYKVPNIVHYTWYADDKTPMAFKHYIGVLSAHKVLKPDKIYIHTNISRAPGEYWDKIVALDSVQAINDGSPVKLFEKTLISNETKFFSDYSDIGRIKYLLKYGGIYLDYDVFVIQSFDKYREKYDFTLGQEQDRNNTYDLLNAGIIVASKDSPFLYLWASGYADDYQPTRWVYNSGWKPTTLWKRFPHLVHVETTKFNRPNWTPGEMNKIWGNGTYNWRDNYALHTWYRYRSKVEAYSKLYGDLAPDEHDVMTMNNTYAEISRYILSL